MTDSFQLHGDERQTELLVRYLDDSLSETEYAEVESSLIADPAVAEELIQLGMQMQTLRGPLRAEIKAASLAGGDSLLSDETVDLDDAVMPADDAGNGWWSRTRDVASNYITLSMVVSGLFLAIILLSMALIVPDWKRFVPGNELKPPSVEFVARLIDGEHADWSTATQANLNEGSDLYIGQTLELTSGGALIRFDNGVDVRLVGPARWRIAAADRIDLEAGQVFAVVEESAQGFQVATAVCEVIDLGTEFAVDRSLQGNVSVYVHAGDVEVDADGWTENIRLKRGESLTISASGEKTTGAKEVVAQLRGIAAEHSNLRDFGTWQSHRGQLRDDPTLVCYYDFQRDQTRPDLLVDVARSADEALHAQLGNNKLEASRPTWSVGRWRGKQALTFDGAKGQFARMVPSEPIDWSEGLTIATWIRFDAGVEHPAVLLAQRDGPAPSIIQMAVMQERGAKDIAGIQFLSSSLDEGGYSGNSIQYGTDWQLLVVTSNPRETVFYRNGREIGRAAGIAPQPSSAPLSIGAIFLSNTLTPSYPLTGSMDELLIYRRALSAEDVLKLFQASRP